MSRTPLTEEQKCECIKWLAEARTALHQLLTGTQIVQVGYGERQLRYTQATINDLRAYIQELDSKCGDCSNRRRPFNIVW